MKHSNLCTTCIRLFAHSFIHSYWAQDITKEPFQRFYTWKKEIVNYASSWAVSIGARSKMCINSAASSVMLLTMANRKDKCFFFYRRLILMLEGRRRFAWKFNWLGKSLWISAISFCAVLLMLYSVSILCEGIVLFNIIIICFAVSSANCVRFCLVLLVLLLVYAFKTTLLDLTQRLAKQPLEIWNRVSAEGEWNK